MFKLDYLIYISARKVLQPKLTKLSKLPKLPKLTNFTSQVVIRYYSHGLQYSTTLCFCFSSFK